MTRITLFYLLALTSIVFHNCTPPADKNEGYLVQGSIEGIDTGIAILANLDLVTNERVDVDTAEIVNGKFTFEGKVDAPYLHTIFLNGTTNKIHLFLENSDININADIDDLENTQISGSREDSLFHSYNMDDIFEGEKGMEIMLNYPDYSFAAFTAYYQFQIHNIHLDTMEMIVQGFDEQVKNSTYYQHLNKLYTTIKKVAISQPAPEFNIPDSSGNMVSLTDFKGKYVLLDFWASWCAPCREANPLMVEAYEVLSDRNFTIVGISVDEDKSKWIKAINKDKLPWTNISNLRGWGEISDVYGVKAVPQNFLLDPDGIIIDKNIEPENMIAKLDKILPEEL